MLRALKLSLAVPAVFAIILFAVANRQVVRVSFDPLSREAPAAYLDLPLFVVALAALALGVLLGGIAAWLKQSGHRQAERRLKREVARLTEESEALRARASDATLAALPPAR